MHILDIFRTLPYARVAMTHCLLKNNALRRPPSLSHTHTHALGNGGYYIKDVRVFVRICVYVFIMLCVYA